MDEQFSSTQLDILSQLKKFSGKNEDTFENKLQDSAREIYDSAKNSKPIRDAYSNSLLAIGQDDKVEEFVKFNFQNDTLNWWVWMALYNDSWVFKRAIDKPSQDMIRCGVTLQGEKEKEQIYKQLKKHRFDFIQLLQWGHLFGGSIAIMMFDNLSLDNDDYKKSMNIDKLKKFKSLRFYVVDRWYGVAPSDELVDDMESYDYLKPKYYNVTLADGKTYTFHHDYVLRFEGRTAPKLIKQGQLQGWGYAEGAHILNEISRDEKIKASIQSLIDKSLIEVIKMTGMRGVFMGADSDNETQLKKRLEMVNWARNFNSLTFLDKDDDYSMNEFSGISGLSDILEKNMWMVSAALEMQGVLFGDLKNGFSEDVNALERYDETINNRCESYLRPVYEKFITILYKIYNINENVEFTFNSLLVKQQDKDKMDALNNFIDLCSKMLQDGVITAQQYATAVKNYSNDRTVDFGFTDEAIKKLSSEIENELEDIDLDNEKQTL